MISVNLSWIIFSLSLKRFPQTPLQIYDNHNLPAWNSLTPGSQAPNKCRSQTNPPADENYAIYMRNERGAHTVSAQ